LDADYPQKWVNIARRFTETISLGVGIGERLLRCQLVTDGSELGQCVSHFPEGHQDSFLVLCHYVPAHFETLRLAWLLPASKIGELTYGKKLETKA